MTAQSWHMVVAQWGYALVGDEGQKLNSIEEDFLLELAQIQAESIGWMPLDEGTYLHVGSDENVIQVVGIVKEEMAGSNVLWLL